MSLIIPANSLSGGYAVDNSCRFNDGSSDTLSKTFGSASSSNTTFTVSAWVKRAKLSANQDVVSAFQSSSGLQTDLIRFGSADDLEFYAHTTNASGNADIQTNRLFRDVGAWYHIVLALDTTQATASNRVKIYVNGVQETSFSTESYMNQNGTIIWGLGSGTEHTIGAVGTSNYFGGYVAEVCYIDGSQLDPTSFGEFDEDTGIWKPISVSGLTFGTNGFYLDFEDSAALGDDVSGNGNNFTVNNLTAIDQTTDTPTNNFATLNPLIQLTDATLSEGNLQVAYGSALSRAVMLSNFGIPSSSGKWYMEFKISASSASPCNGYLGIINGSDNSSMGTYLNQDNSVYQAIGYQGDGAKNLPGNVSSSYGDSFTTGDIIGVAVDIDNKALYFSKNGTFQNSGNPTSGASKTGAIDFSSVTDNGFWFPIVSDASGTQTMTYQCNFGNPTFTGTDQSDGNSRGSFEYAVPSGYLSLCTANLSEVFRLMAIIDKPSDYFNTVLYTGTGLAGQCTLLV
jgi:hypothetical protein